MSRSRIRAAGLFLVSLSLILTAAAFGGWEALSRCEAAIAEEFGPDIRYFRIGYRVTKDVGDQHTIYLNFQRPEHGLAVCRFRRVDGEYRLHSMDVETTTIGRRPASIP